MFRGRRFIPANPVKLLDHEHAEFVIIGASDDVAGELGDVGKGGFILGILWRASMDSEKMMTG